MFSPGTLEITDRNLDLAIDGEGFFSVLLPDGSTGYTRDGGFQLNADGKMVNGSGHILLPEITLPSDLLEINIDTEGRVTGRTAGNADTSSQFGQLTIHRFHPHDDLGGPTGMLDFRREAVTRLISRGFEDAVYHDCYESHCIFPDTHPPPPHYMGSSWSQTAL